MKYLEERWRKWYYLRQTWGQAMYEYIIKFRQQAVALGISLEDHSMMIKYIVDLYEQIHT